MQETHKLTPLFISPHDVMKVLPHIGSYNGAWKRIQSIKKNIGKEKHPYLTLKDFADWLCIDEKIIAQRLIA